MGILYQTTMRAWRGLPAPVKAKIYSYPRVISALRGILRPIVRTAKHQEIYNTQYYVDMERAAGQAADAMAESIVSEFHPTRVMDIGCGTGALLEAIGSHGVSVKGFEYSDAGLEFCWRRNLDVVKFDLVADLPAPDERCDVVVSTEVAEHLPASAADRYVALLCSLAPVIVFTAARPGQGGRDHINEQPHEYWIEKFAGLGFEFQRERSLEWRRAWKSREIPYWYHQNLMIFKGREALTA